jgi:hypothetical protein
MKALSLLQPWATLVVKGKKTIETRSWQTAYRGPLLIHASKSKAGALLAADPPFSGFIPGFDRLPFGALIGRVVLVDVVPLEKQHMPVHLFEVLTLEERAFGDYTSGRFAWMLEDPVQFDHPIPLRGGLGLWNYAL